MKICVEFLFKSLEVAIILEASYYFQELLFIPEKIWGDERGPSPRSHPNCPTHANLRPVSVKTLACHIIVLVFYVIFLFPISFATSICESLVELEKRGFTILGRKRVFSLASEVGGRGGCGWDVLWSQVKLWSQEEKKLYPVGRRGHIKNTVRTSLLPSAPHMRLYDPL